MKHLKIEYGTGDGSTVVLFDADVEEVQWTDSPNGVSVQGKFKRGSSVGSGGSNFSASGFFEKLATASRNRTAEMVEAGTAAVAEEKSNSASDSASSAT